MKFKIIVSLLLMTASSAFAESGEYEAYNCGQSTANANSCSGCQKINDVSLTLKVQPLNNTVLLVRYNNNQVATTVAYENCKVVDKNNWQCETRYAIHTMRDGIFTEIIVTNGSSKLACAKKKSFFGL